MIEKTDLCYPEVKTWFICWNDERTEIKSYGSITPQQCLGTTWNEVDYYTNEAEWLEVLLQNGINPEEETVE